MGLDCDHCLRIGVMTCPYHSALYRSQMRIDEGIIFGTTLDDAAEERLP